MSARRLPPGLNVAPSLLAADYARLGDQLREVLAAGARVIHVDVMDGHFVPPITVGPLVVDSVRDLIHEADGFLDVHLMIEHPERQVDEFIRAGADGITIHQEATPHAHHTLATIREAGLVSGLALNPSTPVAPVDELRPELDLVLCMTVNPGWGGQDLIPTSADKVRRLRVLVGSQIAVEVDGGISKRTAPALATAGASLLVAGSAIFGARDPGAAYAEIVAACEQG